MKLKPNLQLPVVTSSEHTFKIPPGQSPGVFCLRRFVTLVLCIIIFQPLIAQPKIEIKEPKKSFGTVKKGELVNLDYYLTNTGNAPLLITEAEVACSCTSVDFPKQPVLPGQEVKVVVSFDTKTVYDRQDRIVQLYSNDPKSPAKIRFKGFVERIKEKWFSWT